MRIDWQSPGLAGAAAGLMSGLMIIAAFSFLAYPNKFSGQTDEAIAHIGITRVYEVRLQDSMSWRRILKV
jgi:cytochrome bd-type quinol oxidase subunit 1